MSEVKARELVARRATLIFDIMMPTWIDSVQPVCEFCGKRALDEMHHRKYRSQGGEWSASNIVGLCWQCHKRATIHPDWAYALGLSVKSMGDPAQTPVCVWYNERPILLDQHGGYSVAS